MKTFALVSLLLAGGAEGPVERWAKAVGGREKVAAIRTVYREGTLTFQGMEGTIKVWRTADGKYRKEEQVGPFSSIETYDGKTAVIQRGAMPARQLAGEELAVALSKSFANFNAIFYKGPFTVEGNDTISFQPEGGVEWRIVLDPQTSLPKTMIHKEGERTVTVTFTSFETVDGITLENALHRTVGDPRFDAVIRFHKTVINGPVDPGLFAPR